MISDGPRGSDSPANGAASPTRQQQLFHPSGPWPFITRGYPSAEGSAPLWASRQARKGLSRYLKTNVLGHLNRWIGSIFAIGACFFSLASILSLLPQWTQRVSIETTSINLLFFLGSIPFTTAAYLQLYQAANTESSTPSYGRAIFTWHPKDIGWLSCFLQFIGTVLFNFNTFDALLPGLNWVEADLIVWAPNLVGSTLFLSSGYLAFIENGHAHLSFRPAELSWSITFINLLGCIGFMLSASVSYFPSGSADPRLQWWARAFTLQGALCFLWASLMMLPEAVATKKEKPHSPS